MIYTLTLNPSIDYVMTPEALLRGEVNRSAGEEYLPGGKGIRGSLTLNALGVKNTVLGFCGTGFAGDEYARMLKEDYKIGCRLIRVKDDTRINVKINENGTVTEINGGGFEVEKDELDRLNARLGELGAGDTLIMGGSLPVGVPETFYADTAAGLSAKGVRVIADTSGEALREVVGAKPFLIKPNQHELGELFGVEIGGFDDAAVYGKQLVESGCGNVLASLGAAGAVLVNSDGVYTRAAPRVEVKYTVGAGDAMLAGFIAEFEKSGDPEKSLIAAVETGSLHVSGKLIV